MTVIDLGFRELTPDSLPRPRHPLTVRKIGTALVAVLCLALVAASAPVAAPRGLRTLWVGAGIPMNNPRTVAGNVLAAFTDMPSGHLVAYGLRDGTVRWTKTMAGAVDVTSIPAAGVILVSSIIAGQVSVRNTALDAVTGTERWQSTGTVLTTTESGALLADSTPDGLGYAGVRVLDGADGRIRWQRELPGMTQWNRLGPDAGHPDLLVTVAGQDGTATVYRWSDGAEVARGPMAGWPGSDTPAGTEGWVLTTGTTILVAVQNDQTFTVTAYGADGGWHRRWRVEGSASASLNDCVVVVCFGDDGQLTGYDPVSGQVRWQVPGMDYATGAGGGLLTAHTTDNRFVLLRASDGRTVATLDGDFPGSQPEDRFLLLTRAVPGPPSALAITRVDAATGRQFLLGAIPVAGDASGFGYELRDDLLIIAEDHTLTVTAVGFVTGG